MPCLNRFVATFLATTVFFALFCSDAGRAASPSERESGSRAPASVPGESAATILVRVHELLKKGQAESALKKLDNDWADIFQGPVGESAKHLARGRIFEALNNKDQAATEYEKAALVKDSIQVHLQFLSGKMRLDLGQFDRARETFAAVLRSPRADLPKAMKIRSLLALAQATAAQAQLEKSDNIKAKLWKEVVRSLEQNVRQARGVDIYPAFIHLLLLAKRHRGISDCRLARELFAKYPAAYEVQKWGPFMPENQLEGKKLACSATAKDIQERLRRLQFSGQLDRALKEIAEMRTRAVFDGWTLDSFEINTLLAQGRNDEAMALLLKHSESSNGRPQFWNAFGRITVRLGDFTAASSAYFKAFEMAPRSKMASDALFNSAFASYQMQDYDGAEKTFNMLSSRFGRSKVARDARWHLAWMSYLRGDYETALQRWQSLLRERPGGKAKRGDATSSDRIKYWSAMALLRLGKQNEAVTTLRDLMEDPSIGYYAVLAWYRLKSIPDVKLQENEQRLGSRKVVSDQALQASAAKMADNLKQKMAVGDVAEAPADEIADDEASPGSVDSITQTAQEASDEDETSDPEVASDESERLKFLDSVGDGVRDPALQKRLDRVRLLYAIGMKEETRWELQNLESLIRHSQDRRTMMAELHRMGKWDRSSTLGELTFGGPRLRGGLVAARDLWEFAYPKAWPEYVAASAKSFSIPEEMVWSIMRAESQYRAEAHSPVGAMGLMQIMPFTGERIAKDLMGRAAFQTSDLQEPELNVKFGARYLQRLSEKFNGSLPLIAASYNAGPHRVQNWLKGFGALRMDEFIEHIPFVETRNYVKKVSRNFQIYRLLYRDDKGSLEWLVKPVGVPPDQGPNALEVW
jgi:soluble lytic murein transglycosylase